MAYRGPVQLNRTPTRPSHHRGLELRQSRVCGGSALVGPPCIRLRGAWATLGMLLLKVLSKHRSVKEVVSMAPRRKDVGSRGLCVGVRVVGCRDATRIGSRTEDRGKQPCETGEDEQREYNGFTCSLTHMWRRAHVSISAIVSKSPCKLL